MNPHPRIRKTVKWGGAVVCAVLATACVSNSVRSVIWASRAGWWVGTAQGSVFIGEGRGADLHVIRPGWHINARHNTFQWWFDWFSSPAMRSFGAPIWV